MNSRERMLAIAVGCLAAAFLAYFGQSYVRAAFSSRQSQVAGLEKDLQKLRQQALLAKKAVQRVGEYEARSLPPDPEVARTLYQTWLFDEVARAELIDQNVKAGARITEEGVYVRQTFSITGKGTLAQVVELLHAIYRVDYLQRMTLLILKPIPESKLLDVTINLEAVSVDSAEPAKQLSPRPNPRLTLATRDQYSQVIVGRNLFGPPNQPPKLTDVGRQRGYTNRTVEFQVRASDADALDRVDYKLVQSADSSARFDTTSGRFTWTPRKPGEYQFIVRAADDGFPSKSDEETITVSITDPPPPDPPRPPEPVKLAFDDAKYTVLTAVIDVSGDSEIWLLIRPKGQTVKLHVGDKFEIGSIKGVVAAIGQSDFTFQAGGKQRRLVKGDVLDQATSVAKDSETE